MKDINLERAMKAMIFPEMEDMVRRQADRGDHISVQVVEVLDRQA